MECNIGSMLEQFHRREKEEAEENKENLQLGFTCQYNLLRGFKMEISSMERKNLKKWKEMAINTENKLKNKRNEKHRNIREQMCNVALRLEKNRLQKLNEKKDASDEKNRTFDMKSDNPELFSYQMNNMSNNSGIKSTESLENRVLRENVDVNKSNVSFEKNLDGMDNIPALKRHMEGLQALQSRQKELDEWYEVMQKQLDLEKMRLTAKYEEMHLKNIREQQSIIDSSQEFLRCATNNNTPTLLNGNYIQTFSKKNQSTPLLHTLTENVLISSANGPPLLQTASSISTCKQSSPEQVKTVIEKEKKIVIENEIRPSNENECFTSNKDSMEYGTPLTSPDNDINAKTILDNFEVKANKIETFTQVPGTCLKQSSNNIVLSGDGGEKEINGVSDNVITTCSNRRYVCTDSNSEMYDNSSAVSSLVNDVQNMNIERNTSSAKNSIKTLSSVEEGNERKVKHNSFFNEESSQLSPTKLSVEIPDELKPVISVPPRKNSKNEINNVFEIGNNSVEDLMKKPFNELKVRRKSRPVKFFNDPFPPVELLSSHEFDEDVAMTTNNSHVTTNSSHVTLHSPISLPLNKGQHQQKNISSHEAFSSSTKTAMSPNFSTRQEQTEQNKFEPHPTCTPKKCRTASETSDTLKSTVSSVSGKTSSTTSSLNEQTSTNLAVPSVDGTMVGAVGGTMLLTTPTIVDCSPTSTATNLQRVGCSTSTPHQVQRKGEEGFFLEISAVASQQSNDITPKSTMSHHPVPKGADKLYAVAKGFLTRRLFNTIKVQEIAKTIKDTEEFLIDINKENIFSQKLADRQLKVRLQDELSTKRGKMHDIFFNMDARDQMKMLAISRAQVEEKNRKKQAQMKPSRSNPVIRNVGSSTASKVGSNVSNKSTRRKQTTSINDKTSKTKCVASEKVNNNNNVKKGKGKVESNVTNMYVCIAGALKPIQSCTSPTMADRKKCKSPTKTSVQNRYTKKSSASKRLDMNSAVGATR